MKTFVLSLLLITSSCEGNVNITGVESLKMPGGFTEGSGKEKNPKDPSSNPEGTDFGQSSGMAASRLSRREIENVIGDVFGISELAISRLPPDIAEPFDTQQVSNKATNVFVVGFESMAFEIAKRASDNNDWISEKAQCQPADVEDRQCMTSFARNLGMLLWRSTPSEDDISTLLDPAMALAKDGNDIRYGIRFIIAGLLQSPRFIYRMEIGEEDANGRRRLKNDELLTKLSFLIWGHSPDIALLAKADGPRFSSQDLRKLAEEMLADPRAATQIKNFHQMWFGYERLNAPSELEGSFKQETDALLDRVLIKEKLPWKTLFLSDETFVDSVLAQHYGMDDVEEPTWVKYQNKDRAGILSHGSILSLSARDVRDTSVTGRGKEIATVFLCRTIDPPPPGLVTKKPVATADSCKSDAYLAISEAGGSCAGCHIQMDPIGFGMERFDGLGKYREIEYGNENCDIEGVGKVVGLGEFSGPKQLSKMMLESGELTQCAVQQLLTFSLGHYSKTEDMALTKRLHESFVESGQDFESLILALVSDETFRFRTPEEVEEKK